MDQVEEVKSKVDLVELVSEYVQLKKAGRNFKGLCPFHAEKTPSFMVNPELQIFKCFGCGKGGDAYAWLQNIEGMEFGEALQHLAKRIGVELASYRPSRTEEARERLVNINTAAAAAYQFLLTQHKIGKKALDYLKERRVSQEAVEKFRLGYAPGAWDFLAKFLTGRRKFEARDIMLSGLTVEGKGYDRFRDRVMFPLANARGQIVGFAGRVLPGADEKAGGKYINTPETEIYHKGDLLYGYDVTRSEIKQTGWVVVVEGELDAIASWQAGVKNVVAIKGSALTPKQVELLRRVCDSLVLALDADVAGDAAARRGIEIAEEQGLMVKMVKLAGAKDPAELATSDPAEWRRAVEAAIPIYDYYIESATDRHGLGVEGKRRIGRELLPIWATIPDEIVKAHYVKKLAGVLGVGEEDVRAQMAKAAGSKPQAAGQDQNKEDQTKKTRREVVEEYIAGLALKAGKTGLLKDKSVRRLIRTAFWKRVADQAAEADEGKSVKEFVEAMPGELKERVQDLMLTEGEYSEKEWGKAVAELEEIEIREGINTMEDSESKGDELRKLTKRLGELTKGK